MVETAPAGLLLGDLPDGVVAAVVARGASTLRSAGHAEPGRYRGVRRARFLDGRLAASDALGRLGVSDATVGIGPSGEPRWPAGTVGSISHAARCTVAVVAAGADVPSLGVDLEDDRDVDGIEQYVLDERESQSLEGVAPDERRRRLIAAFSAKEAVYKAFFPRVERFFGFHAVALEPVPAGFVARFVTPVDPTYPPGRRFLVHSLWTDDLTSSWTTLEEA